MDGGGESTKDGATKSVVASKFGVCSTETDAAARKAVALDGLESRAVSLASKTVCAAEVATGIVTLTRTEAASTVTRISDAEIPKGASEANAVAIASRWEEV